MITFGFENKAGNGVYHYDPLEIVVTQVKIPCGVRDYNVGFFAPWKHQRLWSNSAPIVCHEMSIEGTGAKRSYGDGIASRLRVGRFLTLTLGGTVILPPDIHATLLTEKNPMIFVRHEIDKLPELWEWGLGLRAKQDDWLKKLCAILPLWEVELSESSRVSFSNEHVKRIQGLAKKLIEHKQSVEPHQRRPVTPNAIIGELGARLDEALKESSVSGIIEQHEDEKRWRLENHQRLKEIIESEWQKQDADR